MDGLLIIDKPAGLTSHDVVARSRRILRERRIGHTGTLDPFATGVLVLLVGRATRLAQFVSPADKEYKAVIRFGFATDTGDLHGKPITPHANSKALSNERIDDALPRFTGNIQQVPPMYSAKKQSGQKLYELARRGEEVPRESVPVTISVFERVSDLKLNEDGTADVFVHVVCSAGTYVRSLADDLGKDFGVGAHLTELRRTRVGDFAINRATTLEQLRQIVDESSLGTIFLPPEAALSNMPSMHLSSGDAQKARNGMVVSVPMGSLLNEAKVQMKDEKGKLIGVANYNAAQQLLHPRVVLSSENSD